MIELKKQLKNIKNEKNELKSNFEAAQEKQKSEKQKNEKNQEETEKKLDIAEKQLNLMKMDIKGLESEKNKYKNDFEKSQKSEKKSPLFNLFILFSKFVFDFILIGFPRNTSETIKTIINILIILIIFVF